MIQQTESITSLHSEPISKCAVQVIEVCPSNTFSSGKYRETPSTSVKSYLTLCDCRQVFLDFVRLDESRCLHFARFFQKEVDIDTTLQVNSQSVTIKGRELAIDWIAHQYPGNNARGIANKFAYEFVALHDSVNGRKAIVSFKPL